MRLQITFTIIIVSLVEIKNIDNVIKIPRVFGSSKIRVQKKQRRFQYNYE